MQTLRTVLIMTVRLVFVLLMCVFYVISYAPFSTKPRVEPIDTV